ncbi:hypothetical protein ACMATS_31440 [Streptoverticillium reticulum]|uniref:hypothetical protein n=1 Tax=Streptoverticillium reticulum TaxID=1433415 RepID=UPI0039BF97D4
MSGKQVDASVIDGALCSRDGEAPWTVAWGKLPPGVETVQVSFRRGRTSQPAARIGVLGQHWAGEVAGRFDKVVVSFAGKRESGKVKPREKTPQPRRRLRRARADGTAPVDPLEEMKQHWGLAALILQPGDVELPELPDLRIIGDQL